MATSDDDGGQVAMAADDTQMMRLSYNFYTRSPGRGQNGGVESSEAGESHSQGDRPVHHTKHLVCKRLERED